ncbi:hypothetical protein CDAR_469081 [Caerostris darwini]|uniref:Uncharacterized protein n=1 Tax=Caerostris darwini TaxID=1538125 RepID=A0AAV4VGV3_9ARAC|nr:hypothetical protein CDAR_469081 [Caerostris darwini]
MFHKIGPRPDPCGIPLSYGWFTSPKVTLLSCRKLCKIALNRSFLSKAKLEMVKKFSFLKEERQSGLTHSDKNEPLLNVFQGR